MDTINTSGSTYICPMHASIREASPGKCPKCGMALVPENARFGLLRHMAGNWRHLVVMGVIMVAVMAAVMMMTVR